MFQEFLCGCEFVFPALTVAAFNKNQQAECVYHYSSKLFSRLYYTCIFVFLGYMKQNKTGELKVIDLLCFFLHINSETLLIKVNSSKHGVKIRGITKHA